MDRLRWRRHGKLVGSLTAVVMVLMVGIGDWRISAVTTGQRIEARAGTVTRDVTGTVDLFDDDVLHSIELTYAQSDYDAMIETFQSEGDKEWIQADVVIDGTRIDNVGIRLKGNSTLAGIGGRLGGADGRGFPGGDGGGGRNPAGENPFAAGDAGGPAPPSGGGGLRGGPGGGASVDEPERLPWLISFDEFVDGRTYDGLSALVVRASSTTTAANEALALALVEQAGEPIQDSLSVSLTVNGSEPVLRLAVELPDDTWDEATFDTDGVLYKALSTGDWSYRGEDPLAYTGAFDQETAKKRQDLAPLIAFLRFLDEATDAEFEADLDEWLDIEGFARYLALQDLLGNFDDIGGPGNNAYLRYDLDTGTFSVLTWDLNLAFSGGGGFPGGGLRGGVAPPGNDAQATATPQPPRGLSRGNVLEERFRATDRFQGLYDTAYQALRQELFTTGVAHDLLEDIRSFLAGHAADLVDAATLGTELDELAGQLDSA